MNYATLHEAKSCLLADVSSTLLWHIAEACRPAKRSDTGCPWIDLGSCALSSHYFSEALTLSGSGSTCATAHENSHVTRRCVRRTCPFCKVIVIWSAVYSIEIKSYKAEPWWGLCLESRLRLV